MVPWRYVVWLVVGLCTLSVMSMDIHAQVSHIVKVTDALNHKPIHGVSAVSYLPTKQQHTTLLSGAFRLKISQEVISSGKAISINLVHSDYHPITHTYIPRDLAGDTVRIEMMPIGQLANEVLVERARSVYQAQGNPALLLLDTLIQARASKRDEYTYRVYDKLNLAIANFDLNNKLLNRLFPFFRNYVTTSKLNGKWVLPLSLRETVYDIGHNPDDDRVREIIRYRNRTGVDQNIDDGTMTQSLEEIFPRIDIFKDDIKLLDNRFVSPLSSTAPRFYKYYLTDTIITRGRVTQVIQYYPYNPRTFCFRGQLYLTMSDGELQVLRCEMEVPKTINLNFVGALKITQDFKESDNGRWVVDKEEMNINLTLFKKLSPSMPSTRGNTISITLRLRTLCSHAALSRYATCPMLPRLLVMV